MSDYSLSLGGDLRGVDALRYLTDPRTLAGGEPGTLVAVTSSASAVDVFSAGVLRMDLEQHVRRHPRNDASIWPPDEPSVHGYLYDLLSPLPPRCHFLEDRGPPPPDPHVILPAQPVPNIAAADDLARYAYRARVEGIVDDAEIGFVATALPILVENALRHGASTHAPPVACLAVEPDRDELQLAVFDLGRGLGSSSRLPALASCLRRSQREHGGLNDICDLSERRDLAISIVVSSGTARAQWRHRWQGFDAAFAPGWCTGLIVHR